MTGVPHATNPSLFPNMPYDTLKDLAGLAHLVDAPLALSVPAASPVKTLADLIAPEPPREPRIPAREPRHLLGIPSAPKRVPDLEPPE